MPTLAVKPKNWANLPLWNLNQKKLIKWLKVRAKLWIKISAAPQIVFDIDQLSEYLS